MNYSFLNTEDSIVFTTRIYAFISGLSISAATEMLKRLEKKEAIIKLTRGVWANIKHPYFSPMLAVPYLLNDEQGYVSFLSALSKHGIISQIPQKILIATTGRSRKLSTPVADYDFIQLKPSMFLAGIEEANAKISYLLASPEKALLDTLYIATRKHNRFMALPELELDQGFSIERFKFLLDLCVQDKRIISAICSGLAPSIWSEIPIRNKSTRV